MAGAQPIPIPRHIGPYEPEVDEGLPEMLDDESPSPIPAENLHGLKVAGKETQWRWVRRMIEMRRQEDKLAITAQDIFMHCMSTLHFGGPGELETAALENLGPKGVQARKVRRAVMEFFPNLPDEDDEAISNTRDVAVLYGWDKAEYLEMVVDKTESFTLNPYSGKYYGGD